MSDAVTPREFSECAGVEDWRAEPDGASALFRTGSFRVGVALVNAIGALAEIAGHHPDVDLRYANVKVRLSTHDLSGLSQRDVHLARQISAVARELGIATDTRHP